ncbi:hypothetical protein ABZT45_48185 [Streptomyces sp. NPDC005356]|uniref:hypothetical protein n=2 Tax=Streptomyces TaxID=1883 RepID=UPI0033BF0565
MAEKALADLDSGERAAIEAVRRLIEAGDSVLPSPSTKPLTSEDAPTVRLVSEIGVRAGDAWLKEIAAEALKEVSSATC